MRKIFLEFSKLIIFFVIAWIIEVSFDNNKIISNKFIICVSFILSLRAILRIMYNTEFNSYYDLLAALISLYIISNYLFTNQNITAIANKVFSINTNCHVIQLFIFHLYWMLGITMSILFAITYLTVAILFCIQILKMFYEYIVEIKVVISKLNIIIKFLEKSYIKDYLNRYLNPLYGIRIMPIYKNLKIIKSVLLIIYLVTGILIIYYFKDIVQQSSNSVNFENFTEEDFKNYAALFFTPILTIFIGKVFKK